MGTDKGEIRREALQARAALDDRERQRGAVLLTERILGHQWFYRGEYLLCYASYGGEISTWEIMEEALRQGKKVYLPRVLQESVTPEMGFYRISSLEDLQPGYRGILEPSGDGEEYFGGQGREERTLMLMPGAAFDRHRNRLGYGKGFYDRFLADKPLLQQRTIGVGFRCQMRAELPSSPLDVRPCQVICV